MPTATTKLNVRATMGPNICCSLRLAPSEDRNLLNKEACSSSRALPEFTHWEKKLTNMPKCLRHKIPHTKMYKKKKKKTVQLQLLTYV